MRGGMVEIGAAQFDGAKEGLHGLGPVGMAFFAGTAGLLGQAQVGLAVKFLEQGAGVLEKGFPQPQLDGFQVADTMAGQVLANQVQESGGFPELPVGNLRGMEFFLASGWASWARVNWSVTVT